MLLVYPMCLLYKCINFFLSFSIFFQDVLCVYLIFGFMCLFYDINYFLFYKNIYYILLGFPGKQKKNVFGFLEKIKTIVFGFRGKSKTFFFNFPVVSEMPLASSFSPF